ncbi:NADPH-dependent FMN reductase [Paenibacillus sp. GP183]|uniref:NADPH-dependent FMN reductase n=1 Tax=Paenibacillus sp. GP183 TaxID=1882751 RepID=UPI00089D941F|nr:NADPH-dependent FMN reductase [Paenibacillus sp. GP183]SEB48644.1 FMN reductase [Paenibacillus sp. GP183]
MARVVIISGSPSASSRLEGVLQTVIKQLEIAGLKVQLLSVRDQSPEDLVYSNFNSPRIIQAVKDIEQADAVIVATPIYKASYTGVLKSFLDLLPQKGLQGKIVLPLAIGGTIAHLLAIDHALKPVLSALNSYHILAGVYVLDTQVVREENNFTLHPEIELRLQEAAKTFAQEVIWRSERVSAVSLQEEDVHAG